MSTCLCMCVDASQMAPFLTPIHYHSHVISARYQLGYVCTYYISVYVNSKSIYHPSFHAPNQAAYQCASISVTLARYTPLMRQSRIHDSLCFCRWVGGVQCMVRMYHAFGFPDSTPPPAILPSAITFQRSIQPCPSTKKHCVLCALGPTAQLRASHRSDTSERSMPAVQSARGFSVFIFHV